MGCFIPNANKTRATEEIKYQLMDFIDLKKQQELIRNNIDKSIANVLDSGQYIMGKEISILEESLSKFSGSSNCIGVASGTDALFLALLALEIGPGDEIITSPFTYFATAESISLIGAKPVFVDIDRHTFNIDETKIEEKIGPNTRAIMPVSLFGQCSDMDFINDLANSYGLFVIEDAAQSFGSSYKSKKSCNLSTIGCTSFFPSKPLGGYGDSGACFTNDEDLAIKIRKLSTHGQDQKYHHSMIGVNARMDTLQAAIIIEKLKIFETEIESRKKVAHNYDLRIREKSKSKGFEIIVPSVSKDNESVFAQYTIKTKDRDMLIDSMKKSQIPYAINYPMPIYRQRAYKSKLESIECKNAERACTEVISLPMHPYLTEEDQDKVIEAIFNF